jgi:hypothetical protein
MRSVYLWIAVMLVGIGYIGGLVSGHALGYQTGRDRVLALMEEQTAISYEDGYADGYVAGASQKTDRAYNEGLIEGAVQMLRIYSTEGGEAMRRQVRILQGKEPQPR